MRRRLVIGGLVLVALAVVWGLLWLTKPGPFLRAVYPLSHVDAIRAAARENRLDPALVAAIIYEESRFRDDVSSHQGAIGLMQVLPSTAEDIAHKTGGTDFVVSDLTDPRVNILYGCYYLRQLLDHYHGSEAAAVAAYNAGQSNVDAWLTTTGGKLSAQAIPFSETRDYVTHVLALQKLYRRAYGAQLGPARGG
ncbi:MAG: lytic transglycosylase domain-containing protein [Thermoleophilia bacterium]